MSPFEFLLVVVIGSILIAAILLGPLILLMRVVVRAFMPGSVECGVIAQIACVVRQNLPLATGVSLAAASEGGWAGTCLKRIARLLAQGLPLSEAVAEGFRGCSSRTLSLIQAGERSGRLSAALDQAESHLADRWRRGIQPGTNAVLYVLAMLCATGLVVSFVMIAIIPKYKEIFKDFGATLPSMTVMLIKFSTWFATGAPPGWVLILLVAWIALFLWARPRRWGTPRWATQAADHIRWFIPGLHRLTFGRDMNLMLETMAQAVESGLDLPMASRVAGELDINTCLRRRVHRFGELLGVGIAPSQAAMQVGLGRLTAMAMTNGERTGRMAESLRFAADYHYALVSRLWSVVRNLAVPAATLLVASFVGWVAIALFLPLVALINAVSVGWR